MDIMVRASIYLLAALAAMPAYAATITVNTTAQEVTPFTTDGDCSLGEAIRAANTDSTVDGCAAGSGADVINLPSGATFTVSFTDSDPNGNGNNAFPLISSAITLNGQGSTLEFSLNIDTMRAFEVDPIGVLNLQNLTIAGFASAGNGGAIYNAGTLTLTDSTLDNNIATLDGGAIYNEDGSVTLTNSTLSGNDAGSEGGGLYNSAGASVTITRSLLFLNISNGAGGGIWNSGILSVTNSTLTDNQTGGGFGGGLYNTGASTAEFESSTIIHNGNSGGSNGAGIFKAGGTLQLHNTIVALNDGDISPGHQSQDIAGGVVSLGYNLVGEIDGIPGGLTGPGDRWGLDPRLGGFSGEVYPLLSTSPAIDAGDPASCPATDQQGVARPKDGNLDGVARCDIGAYELQIGGGMVPPVVCGNFVVQGTEECDDGNANNNDACLNTCVAAACGDGFVQTGVEGCDDGNTTSGDGCSSSCQTETSSTPPPSSPPPSSPAPADTGDSGGSGITETTSDAENGVEVDTAETDSRTTDEEAANSESAAAGGCSRFVGVKKRN